jgi:hypothetical protein
VRFLIALLASSLLLELAGADAGERTRCSIAQMGSDWHYRTRIPGPEGDVKGDKCWYQGPAMKPRDELYWEPAATEKTDQATEFERQRRERLKGWDHKE